MIALAVVATLFACGERDTTGGTPSTEGPPPNPTPSTQPAAPTPPAAVGVIPLGGLGWQASAGGWELVEAGVVEGSGELASIGDVTDIAVGFECRLVQGSVEGVSLGFREPSAPGTAEAATGYRVTFDGEGRPTLSKPGDARFNAGRDGEATFGAEGWNQIRVRTIGGRHEVSLNATRVASAEDPQWAAGRFVLRVSAATRVRCRAFDVSPGG